MAADVKGDAYEGLLEKNAQDVKGGAGQYFTPRAVIQAMVGCVQPRPGEVVVDPACGTGGFLLATHEYLKHSADLDRDQKRHLRFEALRGVELVPNVARLCGRAHSRFPGHALTPTGVMAIRCKQFHLPDL